MTGLLPALDRIISQGDSLIPPASPLRASLEELISIRQTLGPVVLGTLNGHSIIAAFEIPPTPGTRPGRVILVDRGEGAHERWITACHYESDESWSTGHYFGLFASALLDFVARVRENWPRQSTNWVAIISSNISAVRWFDTGELDVRFANGDEYRYTGVSKSVYNAFLDAESKGKFFAREIKMAYSWVKL